MTSSREMDRVCSNKKNPQLPEPTCDGYKNKQLVMLLLIKSCDVVLLVTSKCIHGATAEFQPGNAAD